jgi:putative protease
VSERLLTLPELLAPAGGPAALRAAVNNGADAVYLGIDRLNARTGAENFALEHLGETVREAHISGARVYLTLNVLVLESEMDSALEIVDVAWASGIDAVIVQDLGLLACIRAVLPHVRVHASTQLNAHNSATVSALAEMGVARVTLSRELSIQEIGSLVRASRVELESFAHGALCICYSGQCLMSSLIGRRSANRGRCAQPCRLPYELVDAADGIVPTEGAYLLSPRDLASIGALPALVSTGLAALKIEGRMKSAEYVALVTSVYRKALDRFAEDLGEFVVRDAELSVLAEAFNRGFSEAYLAGERGSAMMSYRRPNNRGILVGRVTSLVEGSASVSLETAIETGDVLEFWTSRGRFAHKVSTLGVEGHPAFSAPAGAEATLAVDRAVQVGDRVFRVANAALLAAARRTFEPSAAAKVSATVSVRAVLGEPLRVQITDPVGRTGSAQGALVEPARTKELTAEDVREHVGRLGGTPFEPTAWDIALSPGVGMGFSELHRVRRAAIEDYEERLLTPWSQRSRSPVEARAPRRWLSARREAEADTRPIHLAAEVGSARAADAALRAGADEAHVPTWALQSWAGVNERLVPLVPRILHDSEFESATQVAADAGRAVVGNLGALLSLSHAGVLCQAHWSLNALNPWSVDELVRLGAPEVWLSPELSERQIRSIASSSLVPVGVALYGRQELMVTEHCVLMAEGECDHACRSCTRRSRTRWLQDRKGYRFPISTDVTGRTHIYNAVPLDLVSRLAEVLATGVTGLRLDLHTEDLSEIGALVERARRAIELARSGAVAENLDLAGATTSGHFFRGVT